MPITMKVSEGLLTPEAEKIVFKKLTDSFLRHNGAEGNTFITPNMIGDIIIIPEGKAFAAGLAVRLIEVQLKVPAFALTTQAQREGFVTEATDIIFGAVTQPFDKKMIYINLVYGSGMWAIGGKTFSTETLLAAVEAVA